MYWVYILYSKEHGKTYVGHTGDVERRLQEHNETGTSGYTKRYRPWVLIHVEQYASRSEAIKREGYFRKVIAQLFLRVQVERGTCMGLQLKPHLSAALFPIRLCRQKSLAIKNC